MEISIFLYHYVNILLLTEINLLKLLKIIQENFLDLFTSIIHVIEKLVQPLLILLFYMSLLT